MSDNQSSAEYLEGFREKSWNKWTRIFLNEIPNIPRNNPVIFACQLTMLQYSTAAYLLYIGKFVFPYYFALKTYVYVTFLHIQN